MRTNEPPAWGFGRLVGEAFFELACLLEGPYGTAAVVLLALGYPHGHPLVRGLLWPLACLLISVGWLMTYMAIKHPFGRGL